jgi:Flp pilus assembly protein TadG
VTPSVHLELSVGVKKTYFGIAQGNNAMLTSINELRINKLKTTRGTKRGHAALELALFSPWIFLMFVGALDWGFYSYALITTQNAARIAAEYTSSTTTTASDATTACSLALGVMGKLVNVGSGTTNCGSAPLKVTAVGGTASDGTSDSVVSVTYSSQTLIPIPGLLTNQLNVTRTVKMRVRG